MGEKQKRERRELRLANQQKGAAFLARLEAPETAKATFEAAHVSIRNQDCPMCGEGGFLSVAIHIQKVHGIGHRVLRQMFGFKFVDSICSNALHERQQEAHAHQRPGAKRRPTSRQISPAGMAVLKNQPNSWVALSPTEQKRAAGRLGALAGWARKKGAASEAA